MKQYKKRTVALVLASVVTVVGAFGAENYKNSLMSLKFDEGSDKSVKMTLLTKQRYDNNINIVVFDMGKSGNIKKVIEDPSIGTIITK